MSRAHRTLDDSSDDGPTEADVEVFEELAAITDDELTQQIAESLAQSFQEASKS